MLPGGLGPAAVIALMGLNELLPHPVWSRAAPAWGLLLTGLLANILRMAGSGPARLSDREGRGHDRL